MTQLLRKAPSARALRALLLSTVALAGLVAAACNTPYRPYGNDDDDGGACQPDGTGCFCTVQADCPGSMICIGGLCWPDVAGTGGASGSQTSSQVVSSGATTTIATGSTGSGMSYDEPGAASVQAEFTISESVVSKHATGIVSFEHHEYTGGNLGSSLCVEQLEFTAEIELPSNLQGCTNGSCTTICPFDDPSMPGSPQGVCVGHFVNIVPIASSYQTDCNFFDPLAWFHPAGDGAATILGQFWFSSPVESAMATGTTMYPTWGSFANAATNANPGYYPYMQVAYVNDNMDGTPSASGFNMGVTLSPNPPQNNSGVGDHVMLNAFVLVFGG